MTRHIVSIIKHPGEEPILGLGEVARHALVGVFGVVVVIIAKSEALVRSPVHHEAMVVVILLLDAALGHDFEAVAASSREALESTAATLAELPNASDNAADSGKGETTPAKRS